MTFNYSDAQYVALCSWLDISLIVLNNSFGKCTSLFVLIKLFDDNLEMFNKKFPFELCLLLFIYQALQGLVIIIGTLQIASILKVGCCRVVKNLSYTEVWVRVKGRRYYRLPSNGPVSQPCERHINVTNGH